VFKSVIVETRRVDGDINTPPSLQISVVSKMKNFAKSIDFFQNVFNADKQRLYAHGTPSVHDHYREKYSM